MPIESIINNLNAFSIFGGIEPDALRAVGDLFESHSYARGYNIIAEGTQGNRFYIIAKGSVEVTVAPRAKEAESPGAAPTPANNAPIRLAVLEVGNTFGEMALIDTQARSATVSTVEPTETLEITNMGLLQIFDRAPDTFRLLMMNVARDLSRRLRETDRRLAVLVETGKLPEAEPVS
jgi:CRP-like cAMP-binding protein